VLSPDVPQARIVPDTIDALSKGVPLNMVSKWMGHAKMETTAIYCNAVGEEQQTLAARMWTR